MVPDEIFEIKRNIVNIHYMEHSHREFEYIGQKSGTTDILIDGKKLTLEAGEAMLIFPFQTHSYSSSDGKCETFKFSPVFVDDFLSSYEGNYPEDNVFSFTLPENTDYENPYLCRSLAYAVCGEFEKQNESLEKTSSSEGNVIISLLLYAERNFCKKCSLSDASVELKKDYSFLSKKFKNETGTSFNKYVNTLRIRKSKDMIRNTTMSLAEIAPVCGFESVRSFERNFKSLTGQSPSGYKKMIQLEKID